MKADALVYGDGDGRRRSLSLFLFSAWAALVALLAWTHVVWRDEARAYTLAIQGPNFIAMVRSLRGDSNAALWYVLIRIGHAFYPHPPVLQAVALLVAFASMLLVVLRSPFGAATLALLLFSRFAVYDYSVMARNYGISMLLLFVIAGAYPSHRDHGLLMGALLFLLANTNVHSVVLVGAFLVFWLLDSLRNNAQTRPQAIRSFLLNAPIAVAGIVVCAATVYPPINQAARIAQPNILTLVAAILVPARSMIDLFAPYFKGNAILLSVLLIGSTLGLIRRPAAMVASWISLIGLVLFFHVVYPGDYRHDALWLVFLIAMYWIAGEPADQQDASVGPQVHNRHINALRVAGCGMFVLLLTIQVIDGFRAILPFAFHLPASRSRDLSLLVSANPSLKDAVIVTDTDPVLESLSYYMPNPTYFLREHRFGNIVRFTNSATVQVSLDDVLNGARQLHASTGKPVIILMVVRLDPADPARTYNGMYDWEFTTTPEQIHRFLTSTHLIKRFGPVSDNNGESYDVYLLD